MCADLAVWATDGLELAGAADPVAGLVFAGPHRVDRLYVGGELVVRGGALVRADEAEIARAHRAQARFAREQSGDLAARPTRHRRGARRRRADRPLPRRHVHGRDPPDDGRAWLSDDLDPGTYRLVFHPPSPFFKRVELEVDLDDGHYHVPLLVSPYSCASYRGS